MQEIILLGEKFSYFKYWIELEIGKKGVQTKNMQDKIISNRHTNFTFSDFTKANTRSNFW